ncbi:MAG: RNA-directed DNA polymerase, partial [Pseudomonadota bacterium]
MPALVKLTGNDLDLALSFLQARGLSFAFPGTLELDAIRSSWDKVRPILESVELLSYDPRAGSRMTSPKQRCLIRPVDLIDPIDSILYTGLTFRIAPAIESRRQRYQTDRVKSFHFNAGAQETKDSLWSDWESHQGRLEYLCNQNTYIGVMDIVDFFPRIYLHRLRNSLIDLSGDALAVRALMRLIKGWADGTSYGIPTGPLASNFLAEALLVEVDEYLLSCDVEFIRWVDDY